MRFKCVFLFIIFFTIRQHNPKVVRTIVYLLLVVSLARFYWHLFGKTRHTNLNRVSKLFQRILNASPHRTELVERYVINLICKLQITHFFLTSRWFYKIASSALILPRIIYIIKECRVIDNIGKKLFWKNKFLRKIIIKKLKLVKRPLLDILKIEMWNILIKRKINYKFTSYTLT